MRPYPAKVLISTLPLWGGGVSVKTRFAVEMLRSRGVEPVLAYYRPYGMDPSLSVPSYRLLTRRVSMKRVEVLDGVEAYEIGAWLPELEFTHYLPTIHWRALLDRFPVGMAISGSPLAALPYARTGRDFLLWVASPWMADRQDRVREFPWARRLLDAAVIRGVARSFERKILHSGRILALSEYTRSSLDQLAGRRVVRNVLPMPVDIVRFCPRPNAVVTGRIAFLGRFNDPRKNIGLLLRSLRECLDAGAKVTGLLIGAEPSESVVSLIASLSLEGVVETRASVATPELAELLSTVDVFVLPSHQEGLCIAALEAMACGCPIVSTRCGGPEEFVVDGETGRLVPAEPSALTERILEIVGDRFLRARLSEGARAMVVSRYRREISERVFWSAWDAMIGAA